MKQFYLYSKGVVSVVSISSELCPITSSQLPGQLIEYLEYQAEDLELIAKGFGYIHNAENSPDSCGSVGWCHPANQNVTGSIPSQDTFLGCHPYPHLGTCVRGNWLMFLSLSFSLPAFLSKYT